MIKRLLLTTTVAIVFTSPALACIALFGPCADTELPMSGDTFQVHAKAGGWLTGPSPNPAILQSAAQGCARRGYSQFVITGAENGYVDTPVRYFNAWRNGYGGVYGNSVGIPPRQTTSAVIKCVRAGGLAFVSIPWLSGEIEVDESYFGGSRKGKRGRGAAGKVPVFGLLKRGGKVHVVIIPNAQQNTLIPIIRTTIEPDSMSILMAFCVMMFWMSLSSDIIASITQRSFLKPETISTASSTSGSRRSVIYAASMAFPDNTYISFFECELRFNTGRREGSTKRLLIGQTRNYVTLSRPVPRTKCMFVII